MKWRYDQTFFYNRWKQRYTRDNQWIIIGISQRWMSPDEVSIRFSFFGFDASMWFSKKQDNGSLRR